MVFYFRHMRFSNSNSIYCFELGRRFSCFSYIYLHVGPKFKCNVAYECVYLNAGPLKNSGIVL